MTPEQIGIVIADRFVRGAYDTGNLRDNLAMHIASAVREERERCAKIVSHSPLFCKDEKKLQQQLAAAIRKGEP